LCAFVWSFRLSFFTDKSFVCKPSCVQIRGENYDEVKGKKPKKEKSLEKATKPKPTKKRRGVTMYEAEDDDDDAGVVAAMRDQDVVKQRRVQRREMTLAERVAEKTAQTKHTTVVVGAVTTRGGSKEVTYVPKAARAKLEKAAAVAAKGQSEDGGRRQRRGIKDLGLKTPFKNQSS
jgi:hypothetical protein